MPREDATLLLVTPSEPEGIMVLESEDKSGMLDELDFIPPNYSVTMKPLLYPIEDYVADVMLLPGYTIKPETLDVFRRDGVTHVALLSLNYESDVSMRFDTSIFTMGFVVYYCAAHNKYRLLHCTQCAAVVAGWLTDMQPQWGMENGPVSGAVQEKGQTYH